MTDKSKHVASSDNNKEESSSDNEFIINKDKLLNTLLLESLREQRLKRRWSIFFKFLLVFYLLIIIYFWLSSRANTFSFSKHVAKVSIKGVIMPESQYSAQNIIHGLKKAFKNKKVTRVILDINSPGGSVVQSDLVYSEIMALKKKYPGKKIDAIISDVGASGAYYIAAAADKILANPASMVGSIGVLYNGFGFVDTINKLGVQRRLYTAGKDKGSLDPFSPMSDAEHQYLDKVLQQMHQIFIQKVIKGRGKRLQRQNYQIVFTGQVWTGIEAKKLGLIDGFSNLEKISQKFSPEKMIDYTIHESYFFDTLASGTGVANIIMSLFHVFSENTKHMGYRAQVLL